MHVILKKILRNKNGFPILQDGKYCCIITTVQMNLIIKYTECHRCVADIAKMRFVEGRSREEYMSALIEVRDMYKIYNPGENEVRALDGVSLTVDEGEFVAIIGQSGSGKSTLMNMLGCLDVPTKGTYILNGKDVSSLSDNELSEVRNNDIGFIFQGFNLIQNLTALENVELPLIYRRVEKSRRRRLAIEALRKVGLQERMKHKPAEMSGGQQQRVAIARAIAAAPPLILADEPTGNLDSKSTRDIMKILDGLNDQGNTIVLITHDDGIAANAKRVVRIMDGKIESDTVKADMEEKKAEPAEQIEEAVELQEVSGAMSEDNRE